MPRVCFNRGDGRDDVLDRFVGIDPWGTVSCWCWFPLLILGAEANEAMPERREVG